jgi:uroporphyrinogen III methyltransferase/synthase
MRDAGPLEGRRILVTGGTSESLSERLTGLGARVFEVPAISFAPPEDLAPLDQALLSQEAYDWLVFTSGNAVRAVKERLAALQRDLRIPIASVGPSTTARCLELLGVEAELQPAKDYRAEGLVEAFAQKGVTGCRMLLPGSDRARPTLAEGLRRLGAEVDVRTAYRTLTPEGVVSRLAEVLEKGVNLVTLASPSAVDAYASCRGAKGTPVVVLGPVTAVAAEEAGLDLRAVAQPSTLDGLVQAILTFLAPTPR